MDNDMVSMRVTYNVWSIFCVGEKAPTTYKGPE